MMQDAVPPDVGAMGVLLGLEMAAVRALCAEASNGEVVEPANYNGGGQIVIAGHKAAVARAMSLAKSRGVKKVLDIPVSAPFHCRLMAPAGEGLKNVLADVAIKPFTAAVISNVEADVNSDPGRVKDLLVRQTVSPVRWEESVRKLEESGCERVFEVGPGKVLRGLIKRISPSLELDNFQSAADLTRIVEMQS
jgi:[acyl-carrier-protein] S-malonyltransferase